MGKTILSATRIPYLAAVNAVRADYLTGCSNGPDICAVRARGLCWAEGMAQLHSRDCPFGTTLDEPGMCRKQECPDREDCLIASFTPAAHPEVLDAVRRLRKPRVIAWDFGGDRCCDGIRPIWRQAEYTGMIEAKEHVHVMLTKNPSSIEFYGASNRLWFGVSVTSDKDAWKSVSLFNHTPYNVHRWVSCEPLLGQITELGLLGIEFVVIGGLSDGNGRIVPPDEGGTRAEWVAPIIQAAHEAGCKVFLKNLPVPIMRQITDSRTGKPFRSMFDLREVPEEWGSP